MVQCEEFPSELTGKSWNKTLEKLNPQRTEWTFNPPTASHMGGVWERMIRSVKRILQSLLGDHVLCEEILSTTLTEIEWILNSRPLTKLPMDATDDKPLIPNHLLLMKRHQNTTPGTFTKEDKYGRRRWRQTQYIASVFWRRWRKEYLSLLQEWQRWTRPQRNLAKDDLVLVVDDNLSCGQWSLGQVVEVSQEGMGE
ncbi:uncharacterized protein [Diadema setosum]|uniref:uncharacterized protein n=1 Tax=Diadema setosum TaxID=31175 RepID=UPI003B3A7E1E